MQSPSDLNDQGTYSTSVSHYAASLSSDIVVLSEVHRQSKDVEDITVVPAIPNKEGDKDITAMPVIPDKEDVDGIPMLATLCNLATRFMHSFRS